MSRFLVDSVLTKVANSTTIDVAAPTGLADGDDVWVVIMWTHPNNAGDTITLPGVNKWRAPAAPGGSLSTSSGGNTSRINVTVVRANTSITDYGGSYAVADQGAGPWTFTFSAASNAVAVAFAFRGNSSAQSFLYRDSSFWPSNTASLSGVTFGGFAGTPAYEETYLIGIAGYNNTDDPTISLVDHLNTGSVLEDDTVDDASVTCRRIHMKAWAYGDASSVQLVTDAPTGTFSSTITGSTTFTSRRGQYGLYTIRIGSLVAPVTETPAPEIDLRLLRLDPDALPQRIHAGMLARRSDRGA